MKRTALHDGFVRVADVFVLVLACAAAASAQDNAQPQGGQQGNAEEGVALLQEIDSLMADALMHVTDAVGAASERQESLAAAEAARQEVEKAKERDRGDLEHMHGRYVDQHAAEAEASRKAMNAALAKAAKAVGKAFAITQRSGLAGQAIFWQRFATCATQLAGIAWSPSCGLTAYMAYVVSQQANSLAQQANSLAQQAVAAAKTNPAACAVLAAYYQGLADECRREAKQAMIQWTDSWKEPKTKQELLDEAEEYQKKADEFRSLAQADASDEPTHSRPAGNPVRPHRGARCYSRRSRRLSSRSSCRLRSCFSGGR